MELDVWGVLVWTCFLLLGPGRRTVLGFGRLPRPPAGAHLWPGAPKATSPANLAVFPGVELGVGWGEAPLPIPAAFLLGYRSVVAN